MRRLTLVVSIAVLAAACAPGGAPTKTFPATGKTQATLIFNTGEAPAGALDYLAEGLAERGIAVTLASGRAWTAAATKAMTPDACTQVGGFGDSVSDVIRFADAHYAKGVDNAVLVAGLIDAKGNYVRSPVFASTIFAAEDPATPKATIDKAYTYYPGYGSYTVLAGARRQDLLGAPPASASPQDVRVQLLDTVEYEVVSRCRKRLDRMEQAAQRKAWDDAQKKGTPAP